MKDWKDLSEMPNEWWEKVGPPTTNVPALFIYLAGICAVLFFGFLSACGVLKLLTDLLLWK